MEAREKRTYEIHSNQIRHLINDLERWETQSLRARPAIIKILQAASERLENAELPAELVEQFVSDVCANADKNNSTHCRDQFRGLFEGYETDFGF